MVDVVRASVVQMPHGETLEDNVARARSLLEAAAREGAHLALLPEYWFSVPDRMPPDTAEWAPRIRAFLAEASRDLGLSVAANLIEAREGRVANLGVAFAGGACVLEQEKIHPMPREAGAGVAGGSTLLAQDVGGVRAGMLVCADILYPEAARILQLQGAEVLLNPVMSPYRAEDPTKAAREALYVARAYDAGAFVLKAGGFRDAAPEAKPPFAVAGRSLIASPWGVLARAREDFAQEVLVAELDLAKLRVFRKAQQEFPARRPDAYGGLI